MYTDASDDACGVQLSQEHEVQNSLLPFFCILFRNPKKMGHHRKEAYGVYYAITKWNCYLQEADIIVQNDHKPLNNFLNGKNANNKVNRWGLELSTYNIIFEWISGAPNKAADCLSFLAELPQDKPVSINMLSATDTDRPTSIPEVKIISAYLLTLPLHSQISHQMFQKQEIQHQKPLQLTGYKLSCRSRNLTLSAKEYPNTYQMEKHHSMQPIFLCMA